VLERLTIQKLHHYKCVRILLADVVDGADVGVIQSRCGLRLATEAAEGLWIARDFVGQELKSDETVQARVLGLVNHSHAAAAQLFEDAIVRDGLADHCEMLGFRAASSYGHGIPLVNECALKPGRGRDDSRMVVYNVGQFRASFCREGPTHRVSSS
jgi:hypothetical protein